MRGPSVEVRLAYDVSLAGKKVAQGDEVAKDQPEHYVLAVETHQLIEQREGHLAQLQMEKRGRENFRNKYIGIFNKNLLLFES